MIFNAKQQAAIKRWISQAAPLKGVFFRSVEYLYMDPIDVLSGAGARAHGGRFAPVGTRAVYVSVTDSGASKEVTAAYFNAAALMSGRRLHHSAIFPGQIRFNSKSGFNPEFPLRAIGKTFLCSPPRQFAGKTHLLFERRATGVTPDAYIATLKSAEHGAIQFAKQGWKSAGVRPISISLHDQRYEAMLLFGNGDWVQSELGRWQVDRQQCRIMLQAVGEGTRAIIVRDMTERHREAVVELGGKEFLRAVSVEKMEERISKVRLVSR